MRVYVCFQEIGKTIWEVEKPSLDIGKRQMENRNSQVMMGKSPGGSLFLEEGEICPSSLNNDPAVLDNVSQSPTFFPFQWRLLRKLSACIFRDLRGSGLSGPLPVRVQAG